MLSTASRDDDCVDDCACVDGAHFLNPSSSISSSPSQRPPPQAICNQDRIVYHLLGGVVGYSGDSPVNLQTPSF